MGLYDRLKTSGERERSGVFLEVDTTRIRVARAGGTNQAYNAAMSKMAMENRRAIEHGLMGNDRAMMLLHNVYAENVVLSWETSVDGEWCDGIEAPTGGDLLPVTVENVVMTFKALPELFQLVKATAEDISLFRAALTGDAVKN